MEKCPHCNNKTISIKNKLSLAPGDVFFCPQCKAKLKVESYAYFVHAVYVAIIGFSFLRMDLFTALAAFVIASFVAFMILWKVIPLKVENSKQPYKKD